MLIWPSPDVDPVMMGRPRFQSLAAQHRALSGGPSVTVPPADLLGMEIGRQR